MSSRRRWLVGGAVLIAAAIAGLWWWSRPSPSPLVAVELNGTEEPADAEAWPACTLRNLAKQRVFYYVEFSSDPALDESRVMDAAYVDAPPGWKNTWRRWRDVSTVSYDGTRSVRYETLSAAGCLTSGETATFTPTLPPNQPDLKLTVVGVWAAPPSSTLRTLYAAEASVRRWLRSAAPPWIRLRGKAGTIRQTFRLTPSPMRSSRPSLEAAPLEGDYFHFGSSHDPDVPTQPTRRR